MQPQKRHQRRHEAISRWLLYVYIFHSITSPFIEPLAVALHGVVSAPACKLTLCIEGRKTECGERDSTSCVGCMNRSNPRFYYTNPPVDTITILHVANDASSLTSERRVLPYVTALLALPQVHSSL